MTDIDALAEQMKAAALSATPGPWTCDKPPVDAATGFRRGVAIAATYGKQMIYADPPGGSYPAADQRHIAASNPANVLAVIEDRDAKAREIKAQQERLGLYHYLSEAETERRAALASLLKEAEDVLKPLANFKTPYAEIKLEDRKRAAALLARIAAVQKGDDRP